MSVKWCVLEKERSYSKICMVYLYLVSIIALEVFRRLLNLADAGDICCFSFA